MLFGIIINPSDFRVNLNPADANITVEDTSIVVGKCSVERINFVLGMFLAECSQHSSSLVLLIGKLVFGCVPYYDTSHMLFQCK